MVMEYNIGQMALIMKVNGVLTKPKDKALFGMLKVMFIVENLKMIWQMVMENIHILTDQNIKESSKTMYKRGMEKRNGSMEPSMSVPIKME
jgi:hypothetical protein